MNLSASPNSFNQNTQPAGVPAPDGTRGVEGATGPDRVVLNLHARLVELEPSAEARAALLKVTTDVDAAWLEGKMLPVLRSRQKAIQAAVTSLEYTAAKK
ncbi:MAG: hypothetical protein JWM25_1173 [Thermoleophilia bacterium]|nr:hypothetical protein [Thermoleophilia bacterium]MCZ4496590.1 hypothetical protein [Thermoleophilia bacterium]